MTVGEEYLLAFAALASSMLLVVVSAVLVLGYRSLRAALRKRG